MPSNTYVLPAHWSITDTLKDSALISGKEIFLSGFVARNQTGDTVTGSAACVKDFPQARAFAELLERIITYESRSGTGCEYAELNAEGYRIGEIYKKDVFPQLQVPKGATWRYAESNGIAAHTELRTAIQRAAFELIERDRLLRSWYTGLAHQILSLDLLDFGSLNDAYEFHAVSFPSLFFETMPVSTALVLGFPKNSSYPFVHGAGAGITIEEAVGRAKGECYQGIGFLFGESWGEQPEIRASPDFHQWFYQQPAHWIHLKKWLEKGHGSVSFSLNKENVKMRFVELKPHSGEFNLRVVKAISQETFPLCFGDGFPQMELQSEFGTVVHPFC